VQANQSPGLFMLAWGLFASAFGLALVTNFRGFAGNFARRARASEAGLEPVVRKLPPWRWMTPPDPGETVKMVRLIAIPFAITGPIITVAGIISVTHGGIAGSGPGALPGPFRFLLIGFAGAAVGWSWLSRRGMFRPVVRRGGWRLASALISSAGGLLFGIGIATGQMTIAIAAWVIGGLSTVVLMVEDKPAG
jgi:hypothetical protein